MLASVSKVMTDSTSGRRDRRLDRQCPKPGDQMPLSDQAQSNLGTAALFAALVRTLGGQDKAFDRRFEAEIESLYRQMEDMPSQPIAAMEMLRWTRELLR